MYDVSEISEAVNVLEFWKIM